jgi:hypothetical protein
LYLQYAIPYDTVFCGSTSTGNVGIGNVTPIHKLHVYGGILAGQGVPGANGANGRGYSFSGDGDTGMYSTGDGVIYLYCNNAVTADLTSGGMRLYGGTDVDGWLFVDYDTVATDTVGIWLFRGNGSTAQAYKSYYYMDVCYWGAGGPSDYCFRVINGSETNSGYIYNTTGWLTTCSRTLKHDINELSDADYQYVTGLLNSTTYYSFRRNDTPDTPEVGFISEYTPEIMGSDGYGMNPTKAAGFLVAAVKAQQRQIDEIETMITQIKELKRMSSPKRQ